MGGRPPSGLPGPSPSPGPSEPPPPPPPDLPWPATFDGNNTALRRLSRDEIITSMQDIVGHKPERHLLPLDQREDHGAMLTNVGATLLSSDLDRLGLALDELAPKAATSLLAHKERGCSATGEAQRTCLQGLAGWLTERAFRRPLRDVERSSLAALFAAAGGSRPDDLQVLESLVRYVFFSPSFLYRNEHPVGAKASDASTDEVLSALQVAVRLSYLVTLRPPDAELVQAAQSAALLTPAERVRQFDRLIATEAGTMGLASFVLEHFGATESEIFNKDYKFREDFKSEYADKLKASALDAIAKALKGNEPTFATMLRTTSYLEDAPVAALTAMGGTEMHPTGDESPQRRKGLMMHPHVIASHTKENGVSPFGIGLFLRAHLLCEPVPNPPASAQDEARDDPPMNLTVRKELEYRTNAGPTCTGCHAMFSPMGYSFLPFDPVGRWTRQDPTGVPWDLSGSVTLHDDTEVSFAGPDALVEAIAEQPQAHGCFAQAALVWALGRRPVLTDGALLEQLANEAVASKGNVPKLFRAIVASPNFVIAAKGAQR